MTPSNRFCNGLEGLLVFFRTGRQSSSSSACAGKCPCTAHLHADEQEVEASASTPVFLVNEDAGRYGAQLVGILRDIDVLDVQELPSAGEADERVADGERMAALVIPAGFTDRVDAYEPAQVRVVYDPAQQQYADLVAGIMNEVSAAVSVQGELLYGIRSLFDASGMLAGMDADGRRAAEAQTFGVLMTQVQALQENPRIVVRGVALEGLPSTRPDNWFTIFMPAFTVMFAFFLVPPLAGELLKEKEAGTLRRLLSAPARRGTSSRQDRRLG